MHNLRTFRTAKTTIGPRRRLSICSTKRWEGMLFSTLMAKCPRCRSEEGTGIAADEQTVQALGSKLAVLLLSDGCREYHKLIVEDLFFAADAPSVPAELCSLGRNSTLLCPP